MKARKRDLIGRRIVDVEWHRFATGRAGGRQDGTDPVLVLDNGRRVWVSTQETEHGEYGHALGISDPKKRQRAQ